MNESFAKPQKLPKLSDTRWLVYEAAVRTVLDQWEPLKKHFNDISKPNNTEKAEKYYTARMMGSMYNDSAHFLYLKFLAPILKELSDLNKKFQAHRADLVTLYSDLRTTLLSYSNRIFSSLLL